MSRRRRLRWAARSAASIATALTIAGCSDATAAKPLVIPSFLVVGDDAGFTHLYRVANGVVTKLSTGVGDDFDPKCAASRIVFSSDRDGNAEIYISDTLMILSRRVTASNAQDDHPAVDPTGSAIVFVSNRSGSPRLWTVPAPALDATTFDTPVALETGSASATPEGEPAWSPDGGRIAFSSTRTGRSEIFIVPRAGGTAVQLTNEIGGAFNPAWSADGSAIYFTAAAGALRLRRVSVPSGGTTDFASDSLDLDAASCDANVCLVAEDPAGGRGSILAFPVRGGKAQIVITRTRNEREAAIVVP